MRKLTKRQGEIINEYFDKATLKVDAGETDLVELGNIYNVVIEQTEDDFYSIAFTRWWTFITETDDAIEKEHFETRCVVETVTPCSSKTTTWELLNILNNIDYLEDTVVEFLDHEWDIEDKEPEELEEIKIIKEGNYFTLYVNEYQCSHGKLEDLLDVIADEKDDLLKYAKDSQCFI